jgi:hypothetical protein
MHRRGEQTYTMIPVDGAGAKEDTLWMAGECSDAALEQFFMHEVNFRNHQDRLNVRIVVRTLRFSVKGGATSASGSPLDTTACAPFSLPISILA